MLFKKVQPKDEDEDRFHVPMLPDLEGKTALYYALGMSKIEASEDEIRRSFTKADIKHTE